MKQSSAVFLLYFLTIGLFSQSLDEDFLSSLPKDIISEIDQNLSTNTNEIQQKDYESFVSSIAKDEKNDVGKDLTVFGRSFFSSYASTFMPINDPAASSNYILDVDHKDNIGDKYAERPNIVGFNEETPYRDLSDILFNLIV